MIRRRRNLRTSPGRERGVATIEAAIAIPLLLLLTFATVEIGRAFVQYAVLANSVRNAARHLASKALLGTTQTIFISTGLLTETGDGTISSTDNLPPRRPHARVPKTR